MKLSISLLLPALLGTAVAASDPAHVYTFPVVKPESSTDIPTLSPNEARLVIAQRLGVSRYHNIHDATNDGIKYIDTFGGQQSSVFGSQIENDEKSHLVLIVEGVTAEVEKSVATSWDGANPSFKISNPPSKTANLKLIEDLVAQSAAGLDRKDCSFHDAVNPFQETCWAGKSNFVHFDAQSVRSLL